MIRRWIVTFSDGGETIFSTEEAAVAQLSSAPPHSQSDMRVTPMVSSELIPARILALQSRHSVLLDYLDMATERADWHGVMDAAADLREVDAELEALRWVISGSEK